MHTVTLTWDVPAAGGAERDGYNIYRKLKTDASYSKIGTATVETYTDSSVAEGVEYDYEVKAFGPGGESSATNEVVASIPFSAPNPPTNLVATVA